MFYALFGVKALSGTLFAPRLTKWATGPGGLVRKPKLETASFACVPANTFLAAGALLAATTEEEDRAGITGYNRAPQPASFGQS